MGGENGHTPAGVAAIHMQMASDSSRLRVMAQVRVAAQKVDFFPAMVPLGPDRIVTRLQLLADF